MSIAWFGAAVTLMIFFLANLVTSVWWASKTNTMLVIMQQTLAEIAKDLANHKAIGVTREEMIRENAKCENERKAMWDKLDDARERLEEIEITCRTNQREHTRENK